MPISRNAVPWNLLHRDLQSPSVNTSDWESKPSFLFNDLSSGSLIIAGRTLFPNKVTFEVPVGHIFGGGSLFSPLTSLHEKSTCAMCTVHAGKRGRVSIIFSMFALERWCPLWGSGGRQRRHSGPLGTLKEMSTKVFSYFQLFIKFRLKIPVVSQ